MVYIRTPCIHMHTTNNNDSTQDTQKKEEEERDGLEMKESEKFWSGFFTLFNELFALF